MNYIGMKMDVVKQEPRHQIQFYLAQLDKLFRNGKIKDDEQRKRFLAYLWPEIKKLWMVITYRNVEKKLIDAKDVEKVFGKLGKIPFEPFKEE